MKQKIFSFVFLIVFLVLSLSVVSPVQASPDTEELFVDSFTESNTDWTEVGSTPYLDDTDGSYIYTKTDLARESSFTFTNSSGSGTINNVYLCVEMMSDVSTRNDETEITLYNGTETYVIEQDVDETTWTYYNYTVTSYLNSWSSIDIAYVYFDYDRVGSPSTENNYVRRALIRVEYTVAGQEYERDATQSISFAFSSARLSEIWKTASQTLTFVFGASALSEFFRGASQTLSTSFSVSRYIEITRLATQSISFAFSAIGALTYERSASQTLNFVFGTTTLSEFVRSTSQSITTSYAVTVLKELLKTASQSLSFAFSSARVPDYARSATQTISTVFSASSLLEFVRTGTQNIATSFNVARALEIAKSVSQTLSFVFGATGFKSYAYDRNGTLGITFLPSVRGIFVPPDAGLALALVAIILALFAFVIGLGSYVRRRR